MSTIEDEAMATLTHAGSAEMEPYGKERVIPSSILIKSREIREIIERSSSTIRLPDLVAIVYSITGGISIKNTKIVFPTRLFRKISGCKYFLVKNDDPADFAIDADINGATATAIRGPTDRVHCSVYEIRQLDGTTFTLKTVHHLQYKTLSHLRKRKIAESVPQPLTTSDHEVAPSLTETRSPATSPSKQPARKKQRRSLPLLTSKQAQTAAAPGEKTAMAASAIDSPTESLRRAISGGGSVPDLAHSPRIVAQTATIQPVIPTLPGVRPSDAVTPCMADATSAVVTPGAAAATPPTIGTITVGLEAEVLVSYGGGGVLKIRKTDRIMDLEPYMREHLPEYESFYDTLLLTTKDRLINVAIEHIDRQYTIEFTTEPSEDCSSILSNRLLQMLQSLQSYIDNKSPDMDEESAASLLDISLWDWAAAYNATLEENEHKFLLPRDFEATYDTSYLETDAEPIIQVTAGSKLLYAFHINATIPLELLYSEKMLDLFPVQDSFPSLPTDGRVKKMWPSCSPDLKTYTQWTRALIKTIESKINEFILTHLNIIGSTSQKARIAGVLRSIFYIYCMQLYTVATGELERLRKIHFPQTTFRQDYPKDFLMSGLPKFNFNQLIEWCSDEEKECLRQLFCNDEEKTRTRLESLCQSLCDIVQHTFSVEDPTISTGIARYINGVLIFPLIGQKSADDDSPITQVWVCKTAPSSIHPLLEFRAPYGNGCDANGMDTIIRWLSGGLQRIRSEHNYCSVTAVATPVSMLTYLKFVAFGDQDIVISLLEILRAKDVPPSDYSYIKNITSRTTSPPGYLVIKDVRAIAALSYFAVNYPEQDIGRTIAIARYLITQEIIALVVSNPFPWVIDGLRKLVSLAVSIFGSELNQLKDIAAPLETETVERPLLCIAGSSSATTGSSHIESDVAKTRCTP